MIDEPSTPSTTLRLDARSIRVLAHPLRSRLLTALRTEGPATATVLANRLGTNTGATSYHLRRLAAVGLVAETDEGRGRERWWRASTQSHGWTERDVAGDADAEAASDWLKRHYLRTFVERYERWLDALGTEPLAWREAAESGDAVLRLSPARLRALEHDLLAVIHSYRSTSPDESDVRQVGIYYHLVPLESTREREPR